MLFWWWIRKLVLSQVWYIERRFSHVFPDGTDLWGHFTCKRGTTGRNWYQQPLHKPSSEGYFRSFTKDRALSATSTPTASLHFFGFLASVICCRPLDGLGKGILSFLMLSNMRMQLEHEHPNSRPPLKRRGTISGIVRCAFICGYKMGPVETLLKLGCCSPFFSVIESYVYIYMKSLRNMIWYIHTLDQVMI